MRLHEILFQTDLEKQKSFILKKALFTEPIFSESFGSYIQSFSSLFKNYVLFFISGTLDSCPNTKTIRDHCKFTETHTSCIKSSAIESTSQLPEEGHFCQNGESSYAQCNGGCLDENNSKYKPFLVYLF